MLYTVALASVPLMLLENSQLRGIGEGWMPMRRKLKNPDLIRTVAGGSYRFVG